MKNSPSFQQPFHLALATIGVVYGDIGTSPLYALKECFFENRLPLQPHAILGVTSLIFWLLASIVTIKYITLILRADHNGEGGILALTTLVLGSIPKNYKHLVLGLGMLGTALFYGDGVITPAISVLGALEGISVATPSLQKIVVPLAVFILTTLFLIQKRGTSKLGHWFGPVMVTWFGVIGSLGLIQIAKNPIILKTLEPTYALYFFWDYPHLAAPILGSVVLTITGVEALYADIGHFNVFSIRTSWFILVWPSLILNYLGQGALLLCNPEAVVNPFYFMVPSWGIYPMVILATFATIIASQSVISGVFSLSWQAVQLGYLPRMRVIHTSRLKIGQVYVPLMNFLMLLITIGAVLFFQSSNRLGAAYGLAITGIMTITTLLTILLALYRWRWSFLKTVSIFGIFLLFDLSLLGTNLIKLTEGGWFSIVIAWIIYGVITTWKQGRQALVPDIQWQETLLEFIPKIPHFPSYRVPGTAVFMGNNPEKLPNSFQVHYTHTPVLHDKIFFLSIITKTVPKVPTEDRLKLIPLGNQIYQLVASYGFSEIVNIQNLFEKIQDKQKDINLSNTTFFVTRGMPVSSSFSRLTRWRKLLFIFLAHNSAHATEFFKIPYHRVVELGIRFRV